MSVAPGSPNLLPLAFVTFLVMASGDPNIALSNVLLLNSLGEEIETTIVNGTVSVVPSASVPEPATLVLMGVGLLTVARGLRRRA